MASTLIKTYQFPSLVQSGVILSEAKLTLARAPSKSWVYSDLVTLVGSG